MLGTLRRPASTGIIQHAGAYVTTSPQTERVIMDVFDRISRSHRYAAQAVQRSVAGSHAYSIVAPNVLRRVRIYLSVLRQRFSDGLY